MSARWIAPLSRSALPVPMAGRAAETEPNGTKAETRRDPCPWQASEAVHETSIRGDHQVVKVRPAQNWWRSSE
jgi:hypothetical protein